MTPEFIAAECGIRQLHARFVDAVWRKDDADFADLWAEDGEWKIATLHFRGREEIRAAFAKLLGACHRVQFLPGPVLLDVGADGTATGRVNCTELAKFAAGGQGMNIGVYHDRYVQEDGAWRFRLRHFSLHYSGPVDLTAELVTESPDFGSFPNFPAPDQPTYTRRPKA